MDDRENEAVVDPLDELVAVSRILGRDPRLVLHGGGNTSVKIVRRDVTGRDVAVLLVKGSGHDLATIGPEGFAVLRLDRLRELLPPTRIGDLSLLNELRCALVVADAPDPSVETLVHASVPSTAVLHSHADAILALTNTEDGEVRVRRVFGDSVVVVPYAMPGPDLAAACQRAWDEQGHEATIGLVVLRHGVFALGDSPRQALANHDHLIAAAEAYLHEHAAAIVAPVGAPLPDVDPVELARFRAELSALAGRPMVVRRSTDPDVAQFVRDPALLEATGHGPLTPDHVIWTKRVPLVGSELSRYAAYPISSIRLMFASTLASLAEPRALVFYGPLVGGTLGYLSVYRVAHPLLLLVGFIAYVLFNAALSRVGVNAGRGLPSICFSTSHTYCITCTSPV